MQFRYYNQFNLSNNLAQAISFIISQKENADYICKNILVTIPEHQRLVFSSRLDGYNPWGGGLNALSGAQMAAIYKKEGKYIEKTIPKQVYSYMVIMENNAYETFSKLTFENKNQIEKTLQALSTFYQEYDGIFNSNTLCENFSYLKDFFTYLDEWRALTGRVTFDDDVLETGISKVSNKKAVRK